MSIAKLPTGFWVGTAWSVSAKTCAIASPRYSKNRKSAGNGPKKNSGSVLLVAAWRGHVTGRLRAGRSGFKPYRPTREDKPLVVLGLAGLATPLK